MLRTLFTITLLMLSCVCLGAEEQKDSYWVDDTLENMVTPIKKWVETQVHSSPPPAINTPSDDHLRQAIKRALAIYPGTVLSAQYTNNQHKIKIISEQGVIDEITIDMEVNNETPNH